MGKWLKSLSPIALDCLSSQYSDKLHPVGMSHMKILHDMIEKYAFRNIPLELYSFSVFDWQTNIQTGPHLETMGVRYFHTSSTLMAQAWTRQPSNNKVVR